MRQPVTGMVALQSRRNAQPDGCAPVTATSCNRRCAPVHGDNAATGTIALQSRRQCCNRTVALQSRRQAATGRCAHQLTAQHERCNRDGCVSHGDNAARRVDRSGDTLQLRWTTLQPGRCAPVRPARNRLGIGLHPAFAIRDTTRESIFAGNVTNQLTVRMKDAARFLSCAHESVPTCVSE